MGISSNFGRDYDGTNFGRDYGGSSAVAEAAIGQPTGELALTANIAATSLVLESTRDMLGLATAYAVVGAGTTNAELIKATISGTTLSLATGLVRQHLADEKIVWLYTPDVDVRLFGAVVDGVADDATAIARCWTALSGIGKVYHPPGISLCGVQMLPPSNIEIYGSGSSSELRPVDGIFANSGMQWIMLGQNKTKIEIHHLKLDGRESTMGGNIAPGAGFSYNGIYGTSSDGANGVTDIKLHDLELTAMGNAINLFACHRVWIERNYVHDTGLAADVDPTSAYTAGGIQVNAAGSAGAVFPTKVWIDENYVYNVSETGIACVMNDGYFITDNYVDNNYGGGNPDTSDTCCSVTGAKNGLVQGNTFKNSSQGGLFIRGQNTGVTFSGCVNNRVIGNYFAGIKSSAAVRFRGIRDTPNTTDYYSVGNVFEGNTFAGNEAGSIQIEGYTKGTTFNSNTMVDNWTTGTGVNGNAEILVPGSNVGADTGVTVIGNAFVDTRGTPKTGPPVNVGATNADDWAILGNTIIGTAVKDIIWAPTTAGALTAGLNPNETVYPLRFHYGNNAGTTILRPLSITATLDFGSIAAGATAELTITLTGATNGDVATVSPTGAGSAPEAGLMWAAFVSGTNTVTVRLHNTTAGAIDPASRSWRVSVIRF